MFVIVKKEKNAMLVFANYHNNIYIPPECCIMYELEEISYVGGESVIRKIFERTVLFVRIVFGKEFLEVNILDFRIRKVPYVIVFEKWLSDCKFPLVNVPVLKS